MNEEKPQEHMGETIHILDIYHELLFRYITEEDEERRKEIKGKVSGVLWVLLNRHSTMYHFLEKTFPPNMLSSLEDKVVGRMDDYLDMLDRTREELNETSLGEDFDLDTLLD